ncbi:MAG: hypothetical protein U9N52_01060 [Campylobacterota bacterium]|nr:hypothetical protein [Campylobacterota bacterium]
MRLTILCVIFYILLSQANDIVPHDEAYFIQKVRNTELIYTEKNIPFAKQAAELENVLQPLYEEKYGYIMDEPLHVGIISEHNQIANGFSTQYPNNRQINYIGGSLIPDYFSSTSWLNTLLYHESAHNYQMNAKDNLISSSLHSVIRNGSLFIIPWFSVPNTFESSFMAEGNAVLNESWHGNGGRLYSGRFKAATLMQAKAGYLTPQRVYNDNLYFLYGSHHYTLGGYYHYYLAEFYGIENVNRYWKEHSKDWFFPIFTNNSMERAIGVDFDTTFEAWSQAMSDEAKNIVEAKGELLATSQTHDSINDDGEEIYFIINESGRERVELVIYDKKSSALTRHRDSYRAGKVVKTDKKTYLTQASAYNNPWRISIGLYDDDGFLHEPSRSKVVEGYLSDGRTVYFDVPRSFDQPQLYVGNAFYAQVNSSVYIDQDDNLYYFVQDQDKKRTLYKNKTALFSLSGYYSYVSGVDSKGSIYFIANSQYGSSLYRYKGAKLSRASSADTIFDARLIDDDHALVVSMGSDAFSYRKIALEQIDEEPFEVKLFVEDLPYYRAADIQKHPSRTPEITTDNPYYAFLAMNYSGTNFSIGESSSAGVIFNASINFADPLNQNQLSLFASRFIDEYMIGGLSYTNNQYFIQYSLRGYGVMGRPDSNCSIIDDDQRDYGFIANAILPFIKKGYYSADLVSSYYQDYESHSRTPLTLSMPLSRSEHFGYSKYLNTLYALTPYAAMDRDDFIYGALARFEHDLPWESYVGFSAQYSKSDTEYITDRPNHSRGVKLSRSVTFDGDPTTLVMPGLIDSIYTQSAFKANAQLRTVFNLASYSFTFPLSLQREALTMGYSYYTLESLLTANYFKEVNEAYLGMSFDTVLVHRFELPMSIEYVYNDSGSDKNPFADEHTVRINFGMDF